MKNKFTFKSTQCCEILFVSNISRLIQSCAQNHSKLLVLTDANVYALHNKKIPKNKNIHVITIEAGEMAKTLNTVTQVLEYLIQNRFDKNSAIICMGGGVISDLGGTIASLLMRGITHINIPTTLLAMVDAAIGGKNGLNTVSAKNIIGTIKQPKSIYVNINFLSTLKDQEFRNGMAEIIKIASISNRNFFKFLIANISKIESRNLKLIRKMVEQSITEKMKLVMKDEQDHSIRKLLNFGHSYGHAIEIESKFTIPHGEAISIGMVKEMELAIQKKLTTYKVLEELLDVLSLYKLPTFTTYTKLEKHFHKDKKYQDGAIKFVYLKSIGNAKIYAN